MTNSKPNAEVRDLKKRLQHLGRMRREIRSDVAITIEFITRAARDGNIDLLSQFETDLHGMVVVDQLAEAINKKLQAQLAAPRRRRSGKAVPRVKTDQKRP